MININKLTSSILLTSALLFTACGGGGSSTTPNNSTNTAPVATLTAISTQVNTVFTGQLTGTDADGDTYTYGINLLPTKGTLVVAANGSFTYTPNSTLTAGTNVDSFTYILTDSNNADSNITTVNISITAHIPVATFASTVTLNEDSNKSIQLTASDTNASHNITYLLVSGPTNGAIGTNTDGNFTYTPNNNYNGSDSFSYKVSDGDANSTAKTINITITAVNDAPTIDSSFADINLTKNNGTSKYDLNVSDIEGSDLNLTVESNNTALLTVTQNWTNVLRQGDYRNVVLDFNLTTETNATGVAKVSINVNDGESNTTKTFDVNITSVSNDIQWKGNTYKQITSSITGEVWLDRNLGASQACTSITNSACYGDYYQWGREANGHQESNSSTTSLTGNLPDNGTLFITRNQGVIDDWTTQDNSGATRQANWNKTDGTSICPVGFRVPNSTELINETKVYQTQNAVVSADVFFTNSNLKFPKAGGRSGSNGSLSVGNVISMWSNTLNGNRSNYLNSSSGFSGYSSVESSERVVGLPVRCIRN